MKVACYPNTERWQWNPTLSLMNAALEQNGVEFVGPGSDYLNPAWLRANRRRVDVIHLHWTQYHYLRSSTLESVWKQPKFIAKLLLIKLWGYRLVWTMHNVYPHERPYPLLDLIDRLTMARLANAVIVHCHQARRELRKRFFRERSVYMAYLGHFIDAYPHGIDRQEARQRLGLRADSQVFLSLGALRPYKGVEHLIEAFGKLEGSDLRLIVAGIATPEYGRQIEDRARGDARITVISALIPVEDVQVYYGAADVVVLPFLNILTSTSAIAAMSFGKPVVAPAIGCLPELLTEDCGILYNADDADGLRLALPAALDADLVTMGQRAYERVKTFTWDAVAKETLRAYLGRSEGRA